MDITTDFGSVILGSNPGGCTKDTNIPPARDFVLLCRPQACRSATPRRGREYLVHADTESVE